jgi:hypothetical protein
VRKDEDTDDNRKHNEVNPRLPAIDPRHGMKHTSGTLTASAVPYKMKIANVRQIYTSVVTRISRDHGSD